MDWDKLRELLEAGGEHLWEQGDEDHRVDARDEDTGKYYCLGCELGVKIQATMLALDDYTAGHGR